MEAYYLGQEDLELGDLVEIAISQGDLIICKKANPVSNRIAMFLSYGESKTGYKFHPLERVVHITNL